MDLFPWIYVFDGDWNWQWDMTPDGERFLVIAVDSATATDSPREQIIVVQDWFTELERLVLTN